MYWKRVLQKERGFLLIKLCSELLAPVEASSMQNTQWPSPRCQLPIKSPVTHTHTTTWLVSQKVLSAPQRARSSPENFTNAPAVFLTRFSKGVPSDFCQHPRGRFPVANKKLQHFKPVQHPVEHILSNKIWISAFKLRDGASFKLIPSLLLWFSLKVNGCSLYMLSCIP